MKLGGCTTIILAASFRVLVRLAINKWNASKWTSKCKNTPFLIEGCSTRIRPSGLKIGTNDDIDHAHMIKPVIARKYVVDVRYGASKSGNPKVNFDASLRRYLTKQSHTRCS